MDADSAARKILDQLKVRVECSDEGSIYGDRSAALRDIDLALSGGTPEQIKLLLAPTGNLQELALENSWGDEFNKLAHTLERLLRLV